MSQKLIDVSKLNQTLITYDKALRALPFATLQEVAAKLGLNVISSLVIPLKCMHSMHW